MISDQLATPQSPLTKGRTKLIQQISCDELISIYEQEFGVKVDDCFQDLTEIQLLECEDTKFRFFYPPSIAGDEKFYETMGSLAWYYDSDRWEHSKARELIKTTHKVLEVGAGSGFFVRSLQDRGIDVVGLELNQRAIEEGMSEGANLVRSTVQEFAKDRAGEFDVVCSFQVLEHIPEPVPFLNAKLQCLKKGGLLLIGVPNNSSYFGNNKMPNRVLNMPPHHVGLWDPDSISRLEELFPLRLRDTFLEPLVGSNVPIYVWNQFYRLGFNSTSLVRLVWKLRLNTGFEKLASCFSGMINGNSMLAVFEKEY